MEREKDKILSSDTRKEILINLKHRNKTLSELSREIGVSKPALLRHLFLLSSIEAVKRIKNGNRFIYYKITEKGKRMTDLIVSIIAALFGSEVVQILLPKKEIELASKPLPRLPASPLPEKTPKITEISTPTPLPSPQPEEITQHFPTLQIEVVIAFILIFFGVFLALRLFRKS